VRAALTALLAAALLALAGCGALGLSGPTAPKTPQEAVNEARVLSIAAADEIKDQNKAGIMSDAVAQSYLNRVKELDKRADDAQALIDVGKGDLNQADLIRMALLALQREVAARAAKERQGK